MDVTMARMAAHREATGHSIFRFSTQKPDGECVECQDADKLYHEDGGEA